MFKYKRIDDPPKKRVMSKTEMKRQFVRSKVSIELREFDYDITPDFIGFLHKTAERRRTEISTMINEVGLNYQTIKKVLAFKQKVSIKYALFVAHKLKASITIFPFVRY